MPTPPTNQIANIEHSDNWLDWFNTRDSSSLIDRQCQNQLFSTFGAAKSKEECKHLLVTHDESTFLFVEQFGTTKKINIFHHVSEVGGTVYDQSTGVGFIQGVDTDLATTLTPDLDILCKKPHQAADRVPTVTSLCAVSSIEDIDALTVGATTVYKPRNFIPITPFLLTTCNEAIMAFQGAPKKVLFAIIEAIKAFDTAHQGDDEYKEKAKTMSKDILFWCYLVLCDSDSIQSTPTTVCSSVSVIRFFRNLTNNSINMQQNMPPQGLVPQQDAQTAQEREHLSLTIQRPLEMLATSAASNQDFLRKLTQIQTQTNDKTSKSFKKLPPKYQNMLQVASSIGEVTATEINTEALEFFKSSSVLNASIMLNSILEGERIECSISSAMTTSLLHGSFLWTNALTPAGLSCSTITSEDLLRTDTLHEGMVLDYSTKFEMSSTSLDKLTKSQVLFPVDIEGTIERIRALSTLATFFFSERSYPSQGLRGLVHKCTDNKTVLRTQAYLDPEFIARFLCAIDDRLYQWLRQCCSAKLVEDTTLSLMNYSALFEDILLSRFSYRLPPNIRKLYKTPARRPFDPSEPDRNKRQRLFEQIRNNSMRQEWKLRQNENWDTIFRAKSHEGPVLSFGAKPCLKYHVKGMCYTDCTLTASHRELNQEDGQKTEAFIRKLRGE
jgi:hypothetical protein